jgi:hypothetical protein
MKAASMRLGAEFHDLDDVRFLVRYLGIESAAEAVRVVEQYIPAAKIPPKTRHALEGLFED